MTRWWPIARIDHGRSTSAQPLAGRRDVWCDAVLPLGGGPSTALADIPPADRTRLCAPRPDLCGLTLDVPRIMGILNVTPDSFSDGGTLASVSEAVDRALAMGADILDIGGESTRPGADDVPVAEEIRRTAPVIRALRDAGFTAPISIDTRTAAVALAALDAGADMVNDVSALTRDTEMAPLVAERGVPVCLMHMRGDPRTMQGLADYDDVVAAVLDHLSARIADALVAGVCADRIVVDPGIGFAKSLQHNVTLLRQLSALHALGYPVLLGASRKGFIGALGAAPDPGKRLPGSLAVELHGAAQAVHILRVHDTVATRQALSLQRAMIGDRQDDT